MKRYTNLDDPKAGFLKPEERTALRAAGLDSLEAVYGEYRRGNRFGSVFPQNGYVDQVMRQVREAISDEAIADIEEGRRRPPLSTGAGRLPS